jgi:hypothetical protein
MFYFTILILGKTPDQNYIEINLNLQRTYIVQCIEGYVSILDKDLNTVTYQYITAVVCFFSIVYLFILQVVMKKLISLRV